MSLTPEKVASFVHAPLSSREVEISFFRYKDILQDNRVRLTLRHLKHSDRELQQKGSGKLILSTIPFRKMLT